MPNWKRNHGTEIPRNLLFFSCEHNEQEISDGYYSEIRTLHLGVCDYVNWRSRCQDATRSFVFGSAARFWEFISECTRRKEVLDIYTADAVRMLCLVNFGDEIDAGRLTLCTQVKSPKKAEDAKRLIKVYKGRFNTNRHSVVIECLYKGRRINITDTYNYFRCSPDEIAASFKGSEIGDALQPDCEDKKLAHCQRTVATLRKAVTGLMLEWEVNGCGNWQSTIASLAYSSFRHMHMSIPPCPHTDNSISMFESKSYRDGRTQLYWKGDIRCPYSGGSVFGGHESRDNRPWRDGPVYVLDVSSLYPSVMRDEVYPRRIVTDGDGKPLLISQITVPELEQCLNDYLCIASVTLRTTDDLFPYALTDRTIYPVGEFNCTLATPELSLALSRGYVRRVNCCTLYNAAPLFTDFVNYWWQRRVYWKTNGDKLRDDMCKIIMDSLAGKFGQRNTYWETLPGRHDEREWQQWPEYHGPTDTVRHYRTIGRQVQRLIRDGWSDTAFVAVAAHINSYARCHMQSYRDIAGKTNCYYQGNDSLVVNQAGFDNLSASGNVAEGELGKLRIKNCVTEAKFYGPRDYTIGTDVVKAGIPSSAEQVAERRWRVALCEEADSLLLRKPDGTVRTVTREISGSDPREVIGYGDDGWHVPVTLSLDRG